MAPVRTTCAYCGVGCGITATPTATRSVDIKGDPDHPANFGKLCSKGTHLGETVGLEGRLLHPMIGKSRAGWDKALDLVARRFRETIARHGPHKDEPFLEQQFGNDARANRSSVKDRNVEGAFLDLLHQSLGRIDVGADCDFRTFAPHPH